MADTPTPRLHIDPPMDQWRVTPRSGRSTPVIATGHQPTFWHPGILAKYLAADVFAKQAGGTALNVVVEHNPVGAAAIDVPLPIQDRLAVFRVVMDHTPGADSTPANRLEPIGGAGVLAGIAKVASPSRFGAGVSGRLGDALGPICEAIDQAEGQADLAMQVSQALSRLMRRYIDQAPDLQPTSTLVTPGFLERLLADPIGCVRAYNRAALAYPEAGIRPLYVGRDVVEAPLWAQDATTCTAVYIDLGDSKRPQLFTSAHNAHLDLAGNDALQYLRPRAITLSAIMRSEHCDLFIHGTGGGVYDQVTERWWRDWAGEDLAPKAVVSADVYMPFDVPVATRDELVRARWLSHHLPHNVDRLTEAADDAESALRLEKQGLLDRMHDDLDKRRRSRAFKRIHAINAELRGLHADALEAAAHRLQDARVGVGNAAVAARRDWFFGLYPMQSLDGLRELIEPAVRG